MGLHNRPNGSTYFTDHPSLAPAIGAAIDAEVNALASTVNSLDDANIDGTPAIQGSKVDLGGAGYLPLIGGILSGAVAHAFEGVWQRMRDTGNGRIRYYNTDAGVIWGVCYNTEYNSGWNGRDVTDTCWRLEMQSDGLHIYNAVSAASGVSPVWGEILHVNTSGIFQVGNVENGAITGAKLVNYAVGGTLYQSNDAEVTHNNSTYTKKKSIYLPRGGTIRVKFDLKKTTAFTAGGRIRRNGVAVGSVQETTSLTYVTFSQDISGWSAGDSLELWIATDGTYSTEAQNLRLYLSNNTMLIPTNTL